MPIERRSTAAQFRSVLIGIVAVAIAVGLGAAVFRMATGRGNAVIGGSGSGKFDVGNAAVLARNIRTGGPFLLSDVSGNGQNRPVYISHDGGDVEAGWHAFEARPIGAPNDCFLAWDSAAKRLTAPCDGSTFPPDGDGLKQYPTEVTKGGKLVVDLKPEADT